jgi:hypothetical protein
MNKNNKAPTIAELTAASHNGGSHDNLMARPLNLQTESGYDAYNPSGIFEYDGRQILAARVERHDDELHSQTRFYSRDSETEIWRHDSSLPILPLQDPFVIRLEDTWLVGGVKVHPKQSNTAEIDYWETQIYGGDSLEELRHVFTGPKNMKDIRLVPIEGGLGVFTRPQGEKGGRGRIGFTAIKGLSELTPQLLYDAPLLSGVIAHEHQEWGGVNEAYPLPDGRIGVLAHLARFVTENGLERDYRAITFIYDHNKDMVTDQQIIACRDCFPPSIKPKRPDLQKVVFPGGMTLDSPTVTVNAGIGDSSAWQKTITNHPFQ